MATLSQELVESFNPRVASAIALATKNAPFAALLGFEIAEQRPGFLRCRLPITEKLHNGIGLLHGGALVSVFDHALSVVVYPHVEVGKWVATLEFKVNYLAPVRVGEIVVDAEVISLRRRIATVEMRAHNGEELVATAMGTVYVRDKPKPAP
jgi:uncharacterized protein (TIGR00369 family)